MVLKKFFSYISEFDKENNDDVEKAINQDYGPLLKIFAILPSLKKQHLLLTIVQIFVYISVLFYHLFLFATTTLLVFDDISLFNLTFHYFLLVLLSVLLIIVSLPKRKHFFRLYQISHKGFYDYKEGDEDLHIKKIRADLMKEKYFYAFLPIYILVVAAFIVILGPLIDQLMDNVEKGPYSEKGLNIMLPINSWYPYNTHKGMSYYVALLGQIATATLVGGVIGSLDLQFITCMQALIFQQRLLNYSLKRLDKRAKNKFKQIFSDGKTVKNMKEDDRYHQCYFFCLRQNIIHHQIINKYFDEVQLYGAIPMFLAFSTATLVIALSMYEMTQGERKLGSSIVSGLLVGAEVFNTFILSMFGERVTSLSWELRDTIYSIKWYENGKNRYIKNVIPIMLERTKRPLDLKCILTSANFETFSTVMNSAYSYFNVLSASKNN